MYTHLDQFVKPRTGTVELLSEIEQRVVAENFAELVDNIMLIHVRHLNTRIYEKFPNESSLIMTYPLDDDRRLHIAINSKQVAANSTDSRKSICVRETDCSNRTYRMHLYQLGPERLDVIRSDTYTSATELLRPVEDEWDEGMFDNDFDDIDETPEQAMEREAAFREKIEESGILESIRLNAKFEEQMGINHLPVDAEEVAQLRELLSRAEFMHQ
ncbi:MAG TPA: hypothetical protein VMT96_00100 [Candidatus Bathyarchaeia archaeon]|nr:hypothetical protein [Candidatus Bathyarchaeia archaeon]